MLDLVAGLYRLRDMLTFPFKEEMISWGEKVMITRKWLLPFFGFTRWFHDQNGTLFCWVEYTKTNKNKKKITAQMAE